MLFNTDVNCVSAFTLGSHDWPLTACINALPVSDLFCCNQLSATATWSGNVDAARIWATKASGYSAIGDTRLSSSCSVSGTPCPLEEEEGGGVDCGCCAISPGVVITASSKLSADARSF